MLAAERAELVAAAAERQRVFDCGLSMETVPEESIAHIEPCGHPFCKECVRGLIVSQIQSQHGPISCSTCTARSGKNRPEPNWELRVDHPISPSDSGLSGQYGVHACVIIVVTRNLVLEAGTTEGDMKKDRDGNGRACRSPFSCSAVGE